MLKETLSQLDTTALTSAGLILFFVVFVSVTLFAMTRTRRQANQWAEIPLTGETSEIRNSDLHD